MTWADYWKSSFSMGFKWLVTFFPGTQWNLLVGKAIDRCDYQFIPLTKFWKISLTVSRIPLSTLHIAPNIKFNYHMFKYYLRQSFQLYFVLTMSFMETSMFTSSLTKTANSTNVNLKSREDVNLQDWLSTSGGYRRKAHFLPEPRWTTSMNCPTWMTQSHR